MGCTPSDLVFGMTVAVPGVFFDKVEREELPKTDFVEELYRSMRELQPTEMAHHSSAKVNVPKELEKTDYVFVRTDAVRPPLVRPYTGPFKVVSKSAKYFIIEKDGKTDSVSIDRLKPAYTNQKAEKTADVIDTKTAANSNPISDEPETAPEPRKRGRPRKSYSEALKTAHVMPTITTRAGRVSRPPRRT